VATQVAIYTRKGTERIIRYAFEAARKRNRGKLVLRSKGRRHFAEQQS
jgi:isocitrate/isopropylmalate dehydrogenase